MTLRACVVLALLSAVEGCGSSDSAAVDCSDVVITPAGPRPKECVHEIPSGATVVETDAGEIVMVDGSVVAQYPPCPCQ